MSCSSAEEYLSVQQLSRQPVEMRHVARHGDQIDGRACAVQPPEVLVRVAVGGAVLPLLLQAPSLVESANHARDDDQGAQHVAQDAQYALIHLREKKKKGVG